MRSTLALLAAALFAPAVGALSPPFPSLITPESPVALEIVHVDLSVSNCDYVRGVELIEGGLRILVRSDDRNPISCDEFLISRVALGAFAPGSYRVEARRSFATGAPTEEMELARFVVAPGPASNVPNDDFPREDLSGVWTSPTQPSTGLFLVHSLGGLTNSPVGLRRAELLTGFWAVFESSGAPTWYLLEMERSLATGRFFEGTVVRYVASGSDTARIVTPSVVGSVSFEPTTTRRRMRINLGAQALDFDIQPLRWSRAAWPGRAPADF